MKAEELKGKSNQELKSILVDMKKEAMNLRFQRTTGELENVSRIRVVRKAIARINTFLQQPEAARIASAPAPKKKTSAKSKDAGSAKKESKKKETKTAEKKPAKKAAKA